MKPERIEYLDGLRGVLAVAVVLSHTAGGITSYAPDRPFIGAYLAVEMFFVLSGFVLCHLLTFAYIPQGRFFWLRFWRLWPLHAAMTLLLVGIYALNQWRGHFYPSNGWDDPMVVVQNLLFLIKTGVLEAQPINGPAWSIGVEFWASAIFLPMLVHLSWKKCALVALPLYAFIAINWTGLSGAPTLLPGLNLGLVKGIAGMALGCVIYKVNSDPSLAIFAPRGRRLSAAIVLLCGAIIAFGLYSFKATYWDYAVLAAFLPLLHSDVARISGLSKWFSSKPLLWMGQISYALYLSHIPAMGVFSPGRIAKSIGVVPAYFVMLVWCIFFAAAIYYLVERPVRGLPRKWQTSRTAAATAP